MNELCTNIRSMTTPPETRKYPGHLRSDGKPAVDLGVHDLALVEGMVGQVVWSLATTTGLTSTVVSRRDGPRARTRRTPGRAGTSPVLEDMNAAGTASHGWTVEQSHSFAELCRRHGFAEPSVGEHPGETTVLSVVARLPD